jgi:hypothetical protein
VYGISVRKWISMGDGRRQYLETVC